MTGNRLVLSGQDNKALFSFLNHRNFTQSNSKYMELLYRWKSTNEIAIELYETRQRTKKRLVKLKNFGLLSLKRIRKGDRFDNYWYLSDGGIYYLMSKWKRSHLKKFLKTNEDRRELKHIKELLMKKTTEVQVDILLNQITICVKEKNYNKINRIIFPWFKEMFGKNYVRFSLQPSFKIQKT